MKQQESSEPAEKHLCRINSRQSIDASSVKIEKEISKPKFYDHMNVENSANSFNNIVISDKTITRASTVPKVAEEEPQQRMLNAHAAMKLPSFH